MWRIGSFHRSIAVLSILTWFLGKCNPSWNCSKWWDKPFTKAFFRYYALFSIHCVMDGVIMSWMTSVTRFSLILPLNYDYQHIVFRKSCLQLKFFQYDQGIILKLLSFWYHAHFSTYDVICDFVLLFLLILPLNRCSKHLNLAFMKIWS